MTHISLFLPCSCSSNLFTALELLCFSFSLIVFTTHWLIIAMHDGKQASGLCIFDLISDYLEKPYQSNVKI